MPQLTYKAITNRKRVLKYERLFKQGLEGILVGLILALSVLLIGLQDCSPLYC